MRQSFSPLAIFDTEKQLDNKISIPSHLQGLDEFVGNYQCAHAFLYAYKDSVATFNAYRRELVDIDAIKFMRYHW